MGSALDAGVDQRVAAPLHPVIAAVWRLSEILAEGVDIAAPGGFMVPDCGGQALVQIITLRLGACVFADFGRAIGGRLLAAGAAVLAAPRP